MKQLFVSFRGPAECRIRHNTCRKNSIRLLNLLDVQRCIAHDAVQVAL